MGELGEIGLLEFLLEADPVVPNLVQALAEDLAEARRIKGLAVVGPAQPVDGFLGSVGQRQIGEETRAVEVVVDPDLEVDSDSFGFEPER